MAGKGTPELTWLWVNTKTGERLGPMYIVEDFRHLQESQHLLYWGRRIVAYESIDGARCFFVRKDLLK